MGIGKSSIARRLSRVLKAHHIELDLVLEKNGLDGIDKKIGCIPLSNFLKADDIILPKMENYLKDGENVVLEACFYYKGHIEHIIENLPYTNYVFTLKAPIETCIERDKRRNKTHGKKAAENVYVLVSRFDYGQNIDVSKKSASQTVKEIISFLPT